MKTVYSLHRGLLTAALSTLWVASSVRAYSSQQKPVNPSTSSSSSAAAEMMSRRSVLRTAAALSTAAVGTMIAEPKEAVAAEDLPTSLYFGVGVSRLRKCSVHR